MNHVQLSLEAQQDLEARSAIHLPANNYTARINFAGIATAHLTQFTKLLPRSEPVFWVTLIARRFVVALDHAANFDPYPLQQWVRAMLPGCSFVGMVEAALYSNVDLVMDGLQKAVSWHVHLLVWGVTAPQLNKLKGQINRQTRTMVPGVKAAHSRPLSFEQIEGQALYMLKAPVNEYRIYPGKKTDFDRVTGEFTKEPTGRFSTKKYQLGPGDLTRMVNIMSGKTLNKLAFATGEGKAVLEAINREALVEHRAAERRERDRESSRRSSKACVKRRASNSRFC